MKGRVIAAVEDMFFAAKIRGTAEQVGTAVEFPRNTEALVASAQAEKPSCIIFDLHSLRFDPFALARRLKADPALRAVPLVGFFSHVQTTLLQQAKEAGFDRVMPRSAFSQRLSEILSQDAPE